MDCDPETAVAHLRRADPVLARIIEAVGPFTVAVRRDPFRGLTLAILYQQLAGTAARAIANRFLAIYALKGHPPTSGGLSADDRFPTPEEVLATPEEKLQTAGLSRQKMAYLRDLARKFVAGEVDPSQLAYLDDEEVIRRLTAIKGVGRWTAAMFLIFSLGRPDVLPVDDLGLRKAVRQAYNLPSLPKAEQLRAIAEPWRPYRSVATWYLWQSQRLVTMAAQMPG